MGNQVDIGNALPYYGNAATSSAPAKFFLLCVAPALVLVIRNHFKKDSICFHKSGKKKPNPKRAISRSGEVYEIKLTANS
jgi:hypothetical protein